MSAKRRQETIAQFSVPLEDGSSLALPNEEVPLTRRARRSRSSNLDDSVALIDDMDGNDSDFVVDDADGSFDGDDEDMNGTSESKSTQSKGKRKASARSSIESSYPGTNPKVMLISLKAVSLLYPSHINPQVLNSAYC